MKITKANKLLFSIIGTSVLVGASTISLTSCFQPQGNKPGETEGETTQEGNDKPGTTQGETTQGETTQDGANQAQNNSLLFAPMKASMARTLSVNVGQGDSEIIQVSQDNQYGGDDDFTILIDGGTGGAQGGKDASSPNGENAVAAALDWMKVKDVDLFVISHPHNDHMYGLPNIILNYGTKNSKALIGVDAWKVQSESKGATLVMKKVTKAFSEKNIPVYDSVQITNFVNEGVEKGKWQPSNLISFVNDQNQEIGSFSVLGCTDKMTTPNGTPNDSMNAYSITNTFNFNNHREIYAGDSEKSTDDQIRAYYNQEFLKSDIYKVSHHGSATKYSNDTDWIKAINPTYAIVSSGTEDSYTLPDVTSLQHLQECGVKPENILGTQPFGKSIGLATKTLTDKYMGSDPDSKTEAEKQKAQAAINKGIDAWKPIDNYLNQNPTMNNNNYGGSVVYNSSTQTYEPQSGKFVNLLTTTNSNWTDITKYYNMVMQGVGIMFDFTGNELSRTVDANTVNSSAWNPSAWDSSKYTPVNPNGGKWDKIKNPASGDTSFDYPTITNLTK